MGSENWQHFSYTLVIICVSYSAMCVWWQDWFKMKMSQKTHIMVVLPKLSSLFVKTSMCDALSLCNLFNDMMHAKWMCHALTQGIRTIKTFIKYKKCCCLSINLSIKKKTQGSSVKCWVYCDKIKTVKSKVQASTWYFAKIFKFLL